MNPITAANKVHQQGLEALKLYKPYLPRQDAIFWEGCYELYHDLIQTGDLFNHRKMQFQKWSMFNTRGGIKAIEGSNSELIFQGVWNKNDKDTKCVLTPSDRQEQMKGGDLLFENPKWKDSYRGQVKSSSIGKGVTFYNSWFQYDPRFVHRLCVVNRSKHMIFCVDYERAQYKVCPLFHDNIWATVPIADFLIQQKFKAVLYK